MADNTADEQAGNLAKEATGGEESSEPAVVPSPDAPAETSAEPAAEQAAAPAAAPVAHAPTEAAAPPPQAAPFAASAPEANAPEANAEPSEQAGPLPSKHSDAKSTTALLDEKRAAPFDEESNAAKLKYPKSVFFIVSNEFCERFSYYGMRTILVLYLTSILNYHKDDATVIYHVFTMFCYFFPLLGSMIADSWLGKFRTIFYLSIVYALGNIVLALASSNGTIDVPGRELTILGLLLIAFGTGGIKPCVSAFGGDQFIIPQQEKQMAQFFSLFYFAINSGSLVSTFITPILREDVKCLDQDSCYPLAFGVPAVLMVVSIIVFVIGKNMYIIKKPQGNVVAQVFKCMFHAVAQKSRSKGQKRDHWLDYADDRYDRNQIEDIKSALRVLFLYLPLPFFWALFDQQGSRWTFQATRMTGNLGGWSLKPDQMQVINPLLILLFIPLFETCIYPILKKCNLLTRPLPRLGTGGVLAAIAFGLSAIVEWQIEPSYAVIPKGGEGSIRIYNGLGCPITFTYSGPEEIDPITVEKYNIYNNLHWAVSGETKAYEMQYSGSCVSEKQNARITVANRKAKTYLIADDGFKYIMNDESKLTELEDESDDVEKTDERARLRLIWNNIDSSEVTLGNAVTYNITGISGGSKPVNIVPDIKYDLKMGDTSLATVQLDVGGVYAMLVSRSGGGNVVTEQLQITPRNEVHMLWLIPQYVVLTAGEVMFSITGLEFSYSQSPLSMKSVMQAGWLLTVAFGNLIVIIIAEAKFFNRQLWEFILFAGLMIVDMVIFALMAMGYKYIEVPREGQDDIALEATKEKSGIDNKNFRADEQ